MYKSCFPLCSSHHPKKLLNSVISAASIRVPGTRSGMYASIHVHWDHFLAESSMTRSPFVHAPPPISWLETPFPVHCPLRSRGSQLLQGSPHKPLHTHCCPESATPHESAESVSAVPVSRPLPLLPGHGGRHRHHKQPTHMAGASTSASHERPTV